MHNSHFYSCCRASTAANCHSNFVVVYSIVTSTVGAVWMSTRMKMRCRRSSRGPWGAAWSPLNRQRWVWLHLSTLPNIQRKTSRKRSGVKAIVYSSMTIQMFLLCYSLKRSLWFPQMPEQPVDKSRSYYSGDEGLYFHSYTFSSPAGDSSDQVIMLFSRFWVLRGWQHLWEWRFRQFFPHVPLQKRR